MQYIIEEYPLHYGLFISSALEYKVAERKTAGRALAFRESLVQGEIITVGKKCGKMESQRDRNMQLTFTIKHSNYYKQSM